MNPFELPGPEFLQFYLVLILVVAVAALAVRTLLRLPGGDPELKALDLDPFEIAYLDGGERKAITAGLASLVHRQILHADSQTHQLDRQNNPPKDGHALEWGLFLAVEGPTSIAAARARVRNELASLALRLQSLGLVLTESQARVVGFGSALLWFALALFGVVKIQIGVERHKPVGLLVLLCVLTAVVGLLFLVKRPLRSRRGDVALARLRDTNAALQSQALSNPKNLSGTDLALAVGLFGMGVLTAGRLAHLQTALKSAAWSSGWSSGTGGSSWSNWSSCGSGWGRWGGCSSGSSCSSSSCGGSSCGGGCGGGGCGGCSS